MDAKPGGDPPTEPRSELARTIANAASGACEAVAFRAPVLRFVSPPEVLARGAARSLFALRTRFSESSDDGQTPAKRLGSQHGASTENGQGTRSKAEVG